MVIGMLAFLYSFILFLIFALAGGLLLAISGQRINRDQGRLLLFAPSLGIGVFVIVLLTLSRLGCPISVAGPSSAVALCLFGLLGLRRLKWRVTAIKPAAPYCAILLLGGLLTGWPLLQLGFNDLSFGNDDMTNYVLSAERLVRHSYFSLPDYSGLVLNKDLTQAYFSFLITNNERSGSELIIALAISLFRIDGFSIFMPTMLAAHLAIISAVGGLVALTIKDDRAALVAMLFESFSALGTLGVTYQLAGQVFGLVSLLTATAFSYLSLHTATIQLRLVAGVAWAAFCVTYPEMLPFGVLGLLIYAARVGLLWPPARLVKTIKSQIPIVGVVIVLCNVSLRIAIAVLFGRSGAVTSTNDVTTTPFPYYLVPSGLCNMFGITNIARDTPDPWLSLAIALGAVMLILTVVACFAGIRHAEPAACVLLAMLLLTVELFARRNGFGLYKIAMYMQPFIWATLATFACRALGSRTRAGGQTARPILL